MALERIELEKVAKVYGRSYALNRVDTVFKAGTLVALLGPNGAGKSTLISMVGTLLLPDRGTVTYDGLSHEQMVRKGRGRFGYVSHDALLYLDLSGMENLVFYAALYDIPNPQARIAELLKRVDMTYAAEKLVRSYSRGMRQRLSIARALLQRPEVLLLDEPFTGLDRWGEESLHELLAEERDEGRIVLLSTHRMGLPLGLCTEVRVLRQGRLLLDRALEPDENVGDVYSNVFRAKDVKAPEEAAAAEEAV